MNKSETLSSLLKAMAIFQSKTESVEKSKDGHNYKYATLGKCIDAARPIMAENGLSVIQLMGDDGNGNTTMETVLGHSSGEYISDSCVIPIAKLSGGSASNPAQVMGASVTYIRRYAYAAILGLAQEDDDAGSATKGTPKHKEDDGKPWYNDSNYQVDLQGITSAIRSGTSPDAVIKEIAESFKVSNEFRNKIKSI